MHRNPRGPRVEDTRFDAVVVGSGPNGLAAAITLARAGHSVLVREAESSIGGGTRSAALTRPGFTHDVCSAVHPLALGSPFFRQLPLAEHGLTFVHPTIPLAHPFDDGTAAALDRSLEVTAASLGPDGHAYRKLLGPLVADSGKLMESLLGPLRPTRHVLALARFGLLAIRSARGLAESVFLGERARALFAGLAGHSMLPLEWRPSAAFGLTLAILGHSVGWPVVKGGSQKFADALVSYLGSLGGEVVTGSRVESLADVLPTPVVLFDLTPRQIVRIAGDQLPSRYREQLRRYCYGPGVFKMDWALDGPVPWCAPECRVAGTVHVGGTLAEIAAAERAVWQGKVSERPFVLVTQPSLFDPTRAPEGMHTLWAYCHVPSGSTCDVTERIEGQIERFAPGFRGRILARSVMPPTLVEQHNANYVGGDINGGVEDLGQLWTRPTLRLNPYAIPSRGLYICSSSTPPGGGVHGMCGYWAATAALEREFSAT
jgi:phytoene dehydrogenase-like protein